jgi:TRAP-type C4-dicarboxylate transport system permease small subunit
VSRGKLRILAGGVAIVGLVLLYPTMIAATLTAVAVPGEILKVGSILAVLGCLLLLLALPWQSSDSDRVQFEAWIGFLSLPPGFVAGLLAAGDEIGLQPFWVVVCALLLGSAIALILQAARLRQRAQSWRNGDH